MTGPLFRRLLPLLCLLTAGAGLLLSLREPWLALFGLPALCFAPGWAIASRLNRGEDGKASLLGVTVDAFWLSVPAAMAGWALHRSTDLGGWAVLPVAGAGAVFGELWARRAAPTHYTASRGERWAVVGGATLLAAWFALSATTIARPLDRYWYLADVEERLPAAGASPEAGEGWSEVTSIGAADDGLLRLRPAGAEGVLAGGAEESPRAFLLHGPVGASVSGLGVGRLTVEASPVERSDEGAVWRYREAGVAGRLVELPADGATLRFSHPAESRLYVLSNRDSIWTLDGSGELRFVHYYQLLNMVEQLVWAEELWVTDVQPPLGTWVLGPAVAFTGGGQPTANVLLLYVLALSVAAMTRLVHRHAPEAPLPAWLLPGAAAVVTGKLLLEPGSAGMPDALYASAVVAGLAGRGEVYMLAAQLLRYPGSAVVALGLLLGGETRKALRGMAGVGLAAAAFGAGGAVTGELDGWLATVAWESGPEHWGDDYAASSLLPRAPAFYLTWLIYAGGTPLLALVHRGRGVRVALGTALIYSGLLATIHHHPTHYFLPLVQLSACACACAAAASGTAASRVLGTAVSTLGVLGLLIFWLWGRILG